MGCSVGIVATLGSTFADNVAQFNRIGINCNDGCTFRGNSVYGNGLYGIFGLSGSVVVENNAYQNGQDGIFASHGSTIIGNTADGNGDATSSTTDDGIECGLGCLVQSNTVRSNQGVGLRLGSDSAYRENDVSSNVTNGVVGGANLGANHCQGTGVVSASCP